MSALLDVRGLEVEFQTPRGTLRAVRGVDLHVEPGEILAVVGESGSGKSVTQLAVMDLLAPNAQVRAQQMCFRGRELSQLSSRERRALCGKELSMIFQDPLSALHPQLSIARQMSEVLEVHLGLRAKAARRRCLQALTEVGIPAPHERLDAYPHELSGGMRQRVMIAMALLAQPSLLFADEPTTALDVTVQAQVLELLRSLVDQRGLAIVLVTHSLGVVAACADRVQVMYAGAVVERASTRELFARPQHPYTRALLASVPDPRPGGSRRLATIPGAPPDLAQAVQGCAFAPRCTQAQARCHAEAPAPALDNNVACHFPGGGA